MTNGKPKLELNKRTIARLNNLEMRHVRGGDGDEAGITHVACTETETRETITDPETGQTMTLELITTILLTNVGC